LKIEIINTGSELMLGRVLNTHQQWLCRQLADRGYLVARQVAVADTAADIRQAVSEAVTRADLVITTGGLGPTSDDLTRDAIADLLGLALHEDPAIWARIQSWFAARKRPLPASTRVQAQVPDGARVLPNDHGTAPGLLLDASGAADGRRPAWLVMLPGPPRELRPMFLEQVIPWLEGAFPTGAPFVCRTLRTTGIGESLVQEHIAGPLGEQVGAGLEIGYCARPGEVDVRLAARGERAQDLVGQAVALTRRLLRPFIFGEAEDSLEAVVVRELTAQGKTLVVAESCTGGRLASRITDVPGASVVFRGGVVSYSNELKHALLGVSAEVLAEHGAVSEPVARMMAEGARARLGADYALALTGIAGPGGGTEAKPVGTVFIALATPRQTTATRECNRYDRDTFKGISTQQALELLRRELVRSRDPGASTEAAS
jgi:nicotinamide-nucleotide amidase